MSRYAASWIAAPALLALVLAGAVWWVGERPEAAGGGATRSAPSVPWRDVAAPARSLPAVDVLHDWDAARARVYATGDVAGLRALYAPGSSAGTTDVRLLRTYLRRGLRVWGMRMQVLSLEVLDRAPRRWRLRVIDRLDGAVAVGDGVRLRLPHDRATTRVLTLRLLDGRWRVSSVVTASP